MKLKKINKVWNKNFPFDFSSSSFSRPSSNFVQSGGSRTSSFSPSGSSTFSRSPSTTFTRSSSSSSTFSNQPQRTSGFSGSQSPENLCMLKDFATDKCKSGGSSCKKCIVDTVQRSCPYDSKNGPPDCNKLRACAQGLSFRC